MLLTELIGIASSSLSKFLLQLINLVFELLHFMVALGHPDIR
jgi:hypothetical protein